MNTLLEILIVVIIIILMVYLVRFLPNDPPELKTIATWIVVLAGVIYLANMLFHFA